MEDTHQPIRKDACNKTPNERREKESDLTCEEIQLEEVAIDGICGVY
jgi:mycofactocin precursor